MKVYAVITHNAGDEIPPLYLNKATAHERAKEEARAWIDIDVEHGGDPGSQVIEELPEHGGYLVRATGLSPIVLCEFQIIEKEVVED